MKQTTNINEAIQQIGVENTQMDYGSTAVNESKLYHKTFTHEGVKCLIIRMTAGHLCGYIETKQDFDENDYDSADELFSVLWGITYVGDGWIGFDCAHSGQMSPLQKFGSDGRYFTLEEVTAMTKDLAEQESKLRGANMLDTKKIKEMLENGEKVRLECVDKDGFINDELNEKTRYNKRCMANFDPLVCSVSTTGVVMADGFYIDEDEYKYFRIVEAKPTFDDLIDVAIQAYKDGVIKSLKLIDYGVHSLSYSVNADANGDENTIFSQHKDYSDGINFINSLYTETFVIESEEDISKVRRESEIVLANGSVFTATFVTQLSRGWVVDSVLGNLNQTYCLFLLKGATVTQKRGNK